MYCTKSFNYMNNVSYLKRLRITILFTTIFLTLVILSFIFIKPSQENDNDISINLLLGGLGVYFVCVLPLGYWTCNNKYSQNDNQRCNKNNAEEDKKIPPVEGYLSSDTEDDDIEMVVIDNEDIVNNPVNENTE